MDAGAALDAADAFDPTETLSHLRSSMIDPFSLTNSPVGHSGAASLLDLAVLDAAVHRQL